MTAALTYWPPYAVDMISDVLKSWSKSMLFSSDSVAWFSITPVPDGVAGFGLVSLVSLEYSRPTFKDSALQTLLSLQSISSDGQYVCRDVESWRKLIYRTASSFKYCPSKDLVQELKLDFLYQGSQSFEADCVLAPCVDSFKIM
ncbi:hypothetical protein KL925_003766 [Ogataea polymorpha]|nr:hypothetical protein KL906_003419 [Ogataea polymorpha]KAG7926004.1 hypothetical protein KL925_003766 [Ogataea polymorpha]